MPQWLALFALLVQFVASYGHFHRQDFDALERGHGALSVVAGTVAGSLGDRGTTDLDCPICASMAMLGSSALPEGVRVPMPSSQGAIALASFNPLHLRQPSHLLFETRGPPLS